MTKANSDLDDLKNSYDWGNVFGEQGYTDPMPPTPEPPGSNVSVEHFSTENVVEVIAMIEGENLSLIHI